MSPIEPNPRVTFRTAYEDDAVLVVEKPPRVVSLPGLGHEHDTLLNGLFATHGNFLQQLGKDRNFGLLHRLDRETSGLMLVALTQSAFDHLVEQFRQRAIGKFYWALSHKPPKEPKGVIRFPIEEVQERTSRWASRKKGRISKGGKPALTAYRVLESNEVATLIEARPVTGRLHQVRVHLDAIGCGILGDELYGPRVTTGASPRLALHAHRLQFEHPATGEAMDVFSNWPSDLKKLLKSLKLHRPDVEELGGRISSEHRSQTESEERRHEAAGDAVGEEDAAFGEDEA